MKLSPWMLALATSTLVVAALALTACGDGNSSGVRTCGDGFCSSSEDEETCPRDCPFVCAPFTIRCEGNVQMICTENGLGETAVPCENGEQCTSTGCLPIDAPDVSPDTGGDAELDMGEDVAGDVAEDPRADTDDDAADAEDAGDDADDAATGGDG